MQNDDKVILFEQTPIPRAVAKLAFPTILSSLVMVIYNLADTYFVGMCNDAIENAAVRPLVFTVRFLAEFCLLLFAGFFRIFFCGFWERIPTLWQPQQDM